MRRLYLLINPFAGVMHGYASALVCANDEDDAREMHPDGRDGWWDESVWCEREDVVITLIGTASDGVVKGVICVSVKQG